MDCYCKRSSRRECCCVVWQCIGLLILGMALGIGCTIGVLYMYIQCPIIVYTYQPHLVIISTCILIFFTILLVTVVVNYGLTHNRKYLAVIINIWGIVLVLHGILMQVFTLIESGFSETVLPYPWIALGGSIIGLISMGFYIRKNDIFTLDAH